MYYLDAFGQKNLGNNRIFVTEKLQISVWYDHFLSLRNKTGLQTVSRPVEQVHYFGGWVEGAKSLWCQGFADRQPYRTGGGSRCMKVGTKVCKIQQTDIQTDR